MSIVSIIECHPCLRHLMVTVVWTTMGYTRTSPPQKGLPMTGGLRGVHRVGLGWLESLATPLILTELLPWIYR